MDPVLTTEQLHAIQSHPNHPVRVIDPQSQQAYVIVRAGVYEQLVTIRKDDYQLSDTYAAQIQAAFRAGWDDSAMDDYNQYDENFKKLGA